MSILDWFTSWAIRQSLGTKRGAQLESNPVFQAAAAAVIPHLVHQAGGDKLVAAVNQVSQVVQLIQAGAQAQAGQTLGDGFVVPGVSFQPSPPVQAAPPAQPSPPVQVKPLK